MLFNSKEFIFAFLPFTVFVFYGLGSVSRGWALRWLILTSFFFYAWWRPLNVLLIAPSILINFALARSLERLGRNEEQRHLSTALLLLGIAFNVAFLGFFKYSDFIRGTINDVFSANLILTHVILPLGLSFITFQKIAFLIDVHAGRVRSFTLQDYCLFVLFFPQLIAGPIVHYREMMPQFHGAPCRFDRENVSVGLTLFSFGLFKKVVLADHIAPLVTPIYEQAATGVHFSLLVAWMAALGFTLQIYFDFSGYSDMALGLARFFGIRLPPNFNSPLKASSIIDFWLRWHMTLTRFLTAYIYNPLVISLTRRRAERGLPGFGGRNTTVGGFIYLLGFPILLTMFVSGLWHGAGYLFILWGVLHGILLTINHGWRLIVPRLWPDRARYIRWMKPIGFILTFVSVAIAMVLFRSSTIGAAIALLKGLIGQNGVALPSVIYEHLGPLTGWLQGIGVVAEAGDGRAFMRLMMWTLLLLFIALACPNTLEILAPYEPALGIRPRTAEKGVGARAVEWSVTLPWAIGVSVIAAMGIYSLGGQSEFLYWQF
jgi:alginate O-acetyltransferase complex protein AlgI